MHQVKRKDLSAIVVGDYRAMLFAFPKTPDDCNHK
jgi:hypothetical protein